MQQSNNVVIKEVGFLRSLFAPIYALGRIFVTAESLANVAYMHVSKLEMETEKTLIPALRTLQQERATLFAEGTEEKSST